LYFPALSMMLGLSLKGRSSNFFPSEINFAIVTLFLTNFVFMFIENLFQLLTLLFFRIWSVIIIWVILALYIRDSVKRNSLGKTEGFFFVFLNIAFVIGPLMGGALAESFNFNFVFGIAAVFPLIALILAGYKVKRDGKIDQDKHKIWSNIKDYFKKKDLIILYFLSLGLAIWWNLIYVFLPLFMVGIGMTEAIIGVVLLLVAVPLILLEFPAGKWADKFGEKRFFIIGYLILFFFSFLVFFVTNNYWILALFVIASAGGGFFEPLRDSYFFKKTSKRDGTRFYPVFTTSFDMGYVVGPAILSSVLFFTNFKTMFLIASLLMLLFAILAIFMSNSKK